MGNFVFRVPNIDVNLYSVIGFHKPNISLGNYEFIDCRCNRVTIMPLPSPSPSPSTSPATSPSTSPSIYNISESSNTSAPLPETSPPSTTGTTGTTGSTTGTVESVAPSPDSSSSSTSGGSSDLSTRRRGNSNRNSGLKRTRDLDRGRHDPSNAPSQPSNHGQKNRNNNLIAAPLPKNETIFDIINQHDYHRKANNVIVLNRIANLNAHMRDRLDEYIKSMEDSRHDNNNNNNNAIKVLSLRGGDSQVSDNNITFQEILNWTSSQVEQCTVSHVVMTNAIDTIMNSYNSRSSYTVVIVVIIAGILCSVGVIFLLVAAKPAQKLRRRARTWLKR